MRHFSRKLNTEDVPDIYQNMFVNTAIFIRIETFENA
jgi:hypothetical protein